ncbi:DnaA N-terminal domain-containing protein [Saccharococcus sp. Marseille-Q5394]|uniref:DnaA N-terminal domain-containing protein n=1 Tax=Saccharococcus sp. Marseille-Q5394 TaxID=2972778 RepID=UPI0021C5FE48|nr:DnaA N-terminal domain-containing protein [Saccharococcus sp. Marseille-Q5394]
MKKITNEIELFEHFRSMAIRKGASEIEIPGVGKFRIFYQELEDVDRDVAADLDGITINDDERFTLWDDVLSKVKQTISYPSYETWFKNTSAILLDDHHIGVACSNSFQVDWLQSHYRDTLLNILEEVTGEQVGIEFFVENSQ